MYSLSMVLTFFWVFLLTSLSFADGTQTADLYDLKKYIKPKYYSAFSPAVSDNLIKSDIDKVLYETRTLTDQTASLKLFSDELIQKDPVLKFSETLFHMIPGDHENLLVPTNSQIFAFHLNSKIVGKLQDTILIRKVRDKSVITNVIQKEVVPVGFVKDTLKEVYQDLQREIPAQRLDELEKRGVQALVDDQKNLERER